MLTFRRLSLYLLQYALPQLRLPDTVILTEPHMFTDESLLINIFVIHQPNMQLVDYSAHSPPPPKLFC